MLDNHVPALPSWADRGGSTTTSVLDRSATGQSWRVLVVDEEERAADLLQDDLQRHGHEAQVVNTGADALRAYHGADVMLIDLELPDLDGLKVCETIRSTCDLPVLAVTGRDSELDRILGLQAGADDYLIKPYGFSELLARMHAVMRRCHPAPPSNGVIKHGPLTIDSATHSILLHDRQVPVTLKEFELLKLLGRHAGTVVPRRQILQQIWSDDDLSRSRTIDTHVNSLRRKLGCADWIVTVRGVGFRLAEV